MNKTRILAALLLAAVAGTAHADPKAEVFAAWDAMIAAKSYRATVETTANSMKFEQTIEIIIPDRMRMHGGPGGDLVITPEGAWIKIPGSDWTEAPPATAALSKQYLSPEFIDKAKAAVKSVAALGTEDVAGKPARTYQVDQVMTTMGVESETSTKLFVDVASGRPVRQEIDARAMGTASRTVQEIEYVADLEIVAPK
jgi:outer membrane lipoprotein-sorting protein